MMRRILSAIGLERRTWSNTGMNGWPELPGPSVVTPATAQGVSAVYACVQAVSETVASLPLVLHRRMDGDRERATDHPLYRVLHDQFNPELTALEGREYLMACVLLKGNGYARVVRGWDGQVRELHPIAPDTVQVRRTPAGLVYEYSDGTGTLQRLLAHEVLHLRHRLADDGIMGVSPITAARGVIELALSEQDHGRNTFNNGAKLLGILKFPGKLKPEQRVAIRDSWASQHAGSANAGRTAVLEEGVDYQAISMSLEDAQWIAARQFSVEEVCRLFRVPPTMVGDLRHGNYSNSVELARQFVTLSLRRHLVAIEQAIHKQLLTEAGRRTYFCEHVVEGILRGDSANRAAFYSSGITAGWMLPSEARKLENLPVIEGIDNQPRQDTATPAPLPYPSKEAAA
ncbi:phage portal protein [Pulveribacter suum]|nr:phage portal protein [Pulveribacter suum]